MHARGDLRGHPPGATSVAPAIIGAIATIAGPAALCLFGTLRLVVLSAALVIERRFEIRLRLIDEARAELVAQGASAHFQRLAFRQVAELERTVGDADQAVDLEAERAEHVLDLAVLAFAQAHGDPDVAALAAVERRFDRTVENAVDGNTVLQLVECFLIDLAMGAHAVTAQPAGGRQFERPRQAAVIGQQQQAFGIDVEATDRKNPRQTFRQVVEHGGTAFRIGIGRHQAAGLVVEPQARALDAADRHAIDFDLVVQRHVDDRRVENLAVQGDAAVEDHPLDVAARRHAGAGEYLGNALGLAVTGRRACVRREFLTLGGANLLLRRSVRLGAGLCRRGRLCSRLGTRLRCSLAFRSGLGFANEGLGFAALRLVF